MKIIPKILFDINNYMFLMETWLTSLNVIKFIFVVPLNVTFKIIKSPVSSLIKDYLEYIPVDI